MFVCIRKVEKGVSLYIFSEERRKVKYKPLLLPLPPSLFLASSHFSILLLFVSLLEEFLFFSFLFSILGAHCDLFQVKIPCLEAVREGNGKIIINNENRNIT